MYYIELIFDFPQKLSGWNKLKQIEFLQFEKIWGLFLTIQNHVFSQQIAQNCWKLSEIAKAYKMIKNSQ